MLINGLPQNILSILDGLLVADLSEKLDVGQIVEGTVRKVLPDGKAQVRLAGQNVLAQMDRNLTAGQTFTARVEQVSPKPVLRFLSISDSETPPPDSRLLESDRTVIARLRRETVVEPLTKSGLKALDLVPGQAIRAQISRAVDGETPRVKFQGRELPVKVFTKDVFLPGEEIDVRVERIADGYGLVAQPREPEVKMVDAAMVKPYLAAKQDFGEMVERLEKLAVDNPSLKDLKTGDAALLEKLRETVKVLIPVDQPVVAAAAVKKQVDQSGINYEAKVKRVLMENPGTESKAELSKDLKGQLLKLGRILERVDSQAREETTNKPEGRGPVRQLEELSKYVKQATDNIELKQLSNHYAKQEDHPIQLQIPYFSSADGKTVKLYVRNGLEGEGKKRGDKQSTALAFLLDMTALGHIQIDAQIGDNRLSVKIGAEKNGVVDFIQARAGDLKSRLKKKGFDSEISSCLRKKEEMKAEDELTRLFVEESSRLVDIKT